MERTIMHIVGGDSRSRAEQARTVFALGHHAEVYSDIDEFLQRPMKQGMILVADTGHDSSPGPLIRRLRESGVDLPVVFVSSEPLTDRAVAAIKAGALDYIPLPLEINSFAQRLPRIQEEAGQLAETYRSEVEARRLLCKLSARQLEVLELLSGGCSNKEIARQLDISPRTVEIHRANMMNKLGAGHAAEAVRIWLAALPSNTSPGEPAGVTHLDEVRRQRAQSASPVVQRSRMI